jgi:hypothetical protein
MMRERTRVRIARAVALDLEGLKGPEIARILGMRPKGLESLRARAEYKEQLASVGNEMIRRMDEVLYSVAPIRNTRAVSNCRIKPSPFQSNTGENREIYKKS